MSRRNGKQSVQFIPRPSNIRCSEHVQSNTISTSTEASSHAAIAQQQLFILIIPPLSMAKYSFIQLCQLRLSGVNEIAQVSKWQQVQSNPAPLWSSNSEAHAPYSCTYPFPPRHTRSLQSVLLTVEECFSTSVHRHSSLLAFPAHCLYFPEVCQQ